MAKDFNVYQWRRNHLNENQVSEGGKSWKKDFEEIMDANDLTQGEVLDFISIYFKDEKGKPTMIGLNEDLEIGNEYTKEEVASMFDKIYFRAKNILSKEDILKLPFDMLRFNGMYSINPQSEKLPNFISPKGPEQKMTMPDNPEDIYGAVGTVD